MMGAMTTAAGDDRPLTGPRGRPLLADVVRSELKRLILGGEFELGSKLPTRTACASDSGSAG